MHKQHISRIRDGVSNVYTLSNLSDWIAKKTRLESKLFSYKDHEYQKDIIDDPAKTLLVNKIAQAGLSEIFARWGIAACTTQENFTLIWTFPTATDAEQFSKARLDPILASSPEIKRALSGVVNSSILKQFNENSFCYIRGTVSETGALSVPADLLIHDEYDRSDMGNIAAYVSRLQHKPTKMRRLFSTPTAAKYGISLMCETAKRKRQIWKCSHCNHTWLPSYEDDVHIPGWDKPKRDINKFNLKDINYKAAKLLCPKCMKEPSIDLEHRAWIVENPTENYENVAYYVSPFCAPAFMTPAYLVKSSTEFDKWSEFMNQGLGLTSEDEQESLTESDIRATLVPYDLYTNDLHFMGVDMGLVCHFVIVRLTNEGVMLVVHREMVPYHQFSERRGVLCLQYKVLVSVHDMFPYTDLIRQVTEFDPNSYGGIYAERLSTETHWVKEQEQDPEEGRLNVRSVMINRNIAFDDLMFMHKEKRILVAQQAEITEDLYVGHLRNMKRVQKFDKFGGIVMKWEKTTGIDHFHHGLLYALIATKLAGTITGWSTPGAVPLVSTFKRRQLG